MERASSTLRTAGIEVDFQRERFFVDAVHESVLGFALREAVTNIVRHSRASTCHIRLQQSAQECLLEVQDDGRGWPQQDGQKGAPSEGEGLRGMRERVEAIGGSVRRDVSGGHAAIDPLAGLVGGVMSALPWFARMHDDAGPPLRWWPMIFTTFSLLHSQRARLARNATAFEWVLACLGVVAFVALQRGRGRVVAAASAVFVGGVAARRPRHRVYAHRVRGHDLLLSGRAHAAVGGGRGYPEDADLRRCRSWAS